MKKTIQYSYYELSLEDCCCPAFVSSVKYYHGRISDITALMDVLRVNNHSSTHDDTLAAFKAFQDGNLEATHKVAYRNARLLTPEEVIDYEDYSFDEMIWEHTNVWDSIYTLKAASIDVSKIILKQGSQYILCIRPVFKDLMCKNPFSPVPEWRPVGNHFWGFPHMMVLDGKYTYPRLFMQQRSYDNLNEALIDLKDKDKIDYSIVCEEIFGDG